MFDVLHPQNQIASYYSYYFQHLTYDKQVVAHNKVAVVVVEVQLNMERIVPEIIPINTKKSFIIYFL